MSGRWRVPPITKETVLLALFALWTQITTIFAINQADAWTEWNRFSKILLMTLLTLMLLQSLEHLRALIWIIVISLGFYGVKGGIFTVTTGGNYLVWGPEGTFIGGNNEIGLALIVTIPLMRYLMLSSKRRGVRFGLGLAIVLSIVAILGTYSRGAFVGLVILGVLLALKSRHRFALVALLVAVGGTAIPFMPDAWSERMETIQTYQQDASAMGRINAWRFAFNLALDRPIVGGGFRTFTSDLFRIYFHDAHSIYFEVLAEQGFVGLAIFVALLISVWRGAGWTRRLAEEDPKLEDLTRLAPLLQASIGGFAVSGAFLGLAYFDLFYALIAVSVLAKAVVVDTLREQNEAAEPLDLRPRRFGRSEATGLSAER
jgi:probable O-glycosylation ligase (exosortase A-associated)